MRRMNKFFAVVFAIMAVTAIYGALFQNAHWHIFTAMACTLLSLLFAADSKTPDNTSLQ